jgi:hypothetical protein
LKSLIALTILTCYVVLSGCAEMPHRRDIETLYLVYGGKATYKQAFLWFERTTYEALVRRGEYFVRWRPGGIREGRIADEGESVRDVIAEIAGSVEGSPSFYFLVRGIGANENIHRGDHTDHQAADLTLVAGDLLIIDPSPKHILFRTAAAHTDSQPADPG